MCLPICGNMMIQGDEQCDDGNDTIYDGVIIVNLFVILIVSIVNGWHLDDFNNCQHICGDGIITKHYEEYNLNPFDLCDKCIIGCLEHCIRCENGLCYFNCLPICDDFTIFGNEQSKDSHQQGNQLMLTMQIQMKQQLRNLCFKPECLKCEQGAKKSVEMNSQQVMNNVMITYNLQQIQLWKWMYICNYGICERCQSGYFGEQYHCKSICGDKIIVHPEVCDDANLEPYDGCQFVSIPVFHNVQHVHWEFALKWENQIQMMNNIKMKFQLVVLIIVTSVKIKMFVQCANNIFNQVIHFIFLFVVMELSFLALNNVKMEMIYHIMVAINASVNVLTAVLNVKK
ncbi:unnamed protein product (macronuclear) [Paramecium tetraurelia]|uniref:Insulin-like growth factor binding protein, N-terminal n=1 Tax=Paramecium tetraurelia TaxID=5888 RepID=A0CQZ2_PARTE|nr:uncharacterized protein GSPATT00038865001 [Paramecium tetraurelia]CAK73209.1 unnamed protein product [Paramecium tetraurelia]|eukprot:XP_001440606.1 hypothetical protein (macronuclear) [Paramecium tetraurelia strain d4-2]